MSESNVVFRYSQESKFKKNGIKNTIKEKITEGDKGFSFVYIKKEGDKFYKIYAKETEKNKFNIIEKIDEKETTSDVSDKELLKILKTHKVETVIDYMTKGRGTYKNKISSKKTLSRTLA
jgi:hypothetical protein